MKLLLPRSHVRENSFAFFLARRKLFRLNPFERERLFWAEEERAALFAEAQGETFPISLLPRVDGTEAEAPVRVHEDIHEPVTLTQYFGYGEKRKLLVADVTRDLLALRSGRIESHPEEILHSLIAALFHEDVSVSHEHTHRCQITQYVSQGN